MPLHGQEDDDFAYEDEHIEMESENQEYDDLDETEFDTRPALIRGEPKPPITASSAAPKPPIAEAVPTPKHQSSAEAHPAPRTSAPNIDERPSVRQEPASSGPRQSPAAARERGKRAVKPARKSLAKVKAAGQARPKRGARAQAKKARQPVQKKALKTKTKAPIKKAPQAKRSSLVAKKTTKKAAKKAKETGAKRTKRRT